MHSKVCMRAVSSSAAKADSEDSGEGLEEEEEAEEADEAEEDAFSIPSSDSVLMKEGPGAAEGEAAGDPKEDAAGGGAALVLGGADLGAYRKRRYRVAGEGAADG
jgi:hypothetical protein